MHLLLCLLLAASGSIPLQASPINAYYYQPQQSDQSQTNVQAPLSPSTYTFPLPPPSFFFRPAPPVVNNEPSNNKPFTPIYLQPERSQKSLDITKDEETPNPILIRYETRSENFSEEEAPPASSTTPKYPSQNVAPIPVQMPKINTATTKTSVPLVVIKNDLSIPHTPNSSTSPKDNAAPTPLQMHISPTTTTTESVPLVVIKYEPSTSHPDPASSAPVPPTPQPVQMSTTPIMQTPLLMPAARVYKKEKSTEVENSQVETVIDSMINAISKSKASTRFSKTKSLYRNKGLKNFTKPKTFADHVPILKRDYLMLPDMYKSSFEAGNGIKSEELGYTKFFEGSKDIDTDDEQGSNATGNEVEDDDFGISDMIVHVKSGEVTWTSPECIQFTLRYVADENGYHPTIEELPIEDKKDCKSYRVGNAEVVD